MEPKTPDERFDWGKHLNKFYARHYAGGYEGVKVAGVALVRLDGEPMLLLAQRAYDETDAEDVRETWEFPGGHLAPGEESFDGAMREFTEEIGVQFPPGRVVGGWRGGKDDEYQGFVYLCTEVWAAEAVPLSDEVQAAGWFTPEQAATLPLRPECAKMDFEELIRMAEQPVSGNREPVEAATQVGYAENYLHVNEDDNVIAEVSTEADAEPDLSFADLEMAAIPIHGVLAPEDLESGDSRGFNAGAVTARPYRLPFMWQEKQTSGHDNSGVIGSVDRLMRKDGLIHWEGALMPSEEAGKFAELLAFFGRFGVSVDGDKGSLDNERTRASGVVWFDAVRAAGLTAVSIPAFAEAYVAFGPHPDMPATDSPDMAVLRASGDMVTFDRGPGWVTNPRETKRLHDYWTKKGQTGYAKIGWGTPGDFTRAKKLIGEKIGANSPEDMRFLNQIIAQWHYDALGYWPGDLDKPGNKTSAEARAERAARASLVDLSGVEDTTEEPPGAAWEAVLVSSAGPRQGQRVLPPASYFTRHPNTGALVIDEPDENGVRRTYGYAAEDGVCHIGYDGQCIEAPKDMTDTHPEFHLGRTKTADAGYISTGVITYKVNHRDAEAILSETAEQAHFDNIEHAWCAVRLGVDERGTWFSGVVLPHVPEEDLVLIEATGQVSAEWKYGALRGLQAVNIPGFPVMRSSAAYDDEGNVIALVASAHGLGGCEPNAAEQMDALSQIEAEVRMAAVRKQIIASMASNAVKGAD